MGSTHSHVHIHTKILEFSIGNPSPTYFPKNSFTFWQMNSRSSGFNP